MLKGHVQIDLHNHNSGFTERYEQDNMVTNALNKIIPHWMGGNSKYANDGIMPICTKALGGLMMFDNVLTEDADNIFFPSEAHLIASAGQGVNSSNPLGGSRNSSESKALATGYQTVWDFNTSQANGNIRSLARTLAAGGDWVEPFYGMWGTQVNALRRLNGDRGFECTPLCYDEEKQEMYFFSSDGRSSSSVYDSNRRIYTYTFTATIYKVYVPTEKYKVADSAYRCDYPEAVTQVSFDIERFGDEPWWYFVNGYDGYAYCIWADQNTSGNGTFRYRKLKLSDYSFELSDEIVVSVASCSLRGGLSNAIINNGKAILRGYNSRWFYIVDLANTVNVRAVDLGEGWWSEVNARLTNYRNGIVKFIITRNSSSASRYYFADALLYPDGWVLSQAPYRENTSFAWDYEHRGFRLMTDGLMVWGANYYERSYGYLVNNYLGTICNLSSAIHKTAASSMKVIYTLTDVDE